MSPLLPYRLPSTCTKAERRDALSVERWLTATLRTEPEAAQEEVVVVEVAALGSACSEKEEEWDV